MRGNYIQNYYAEIYKEYYQFNIAEMERGLGYSLHPQLKEDETKPRKKRGGPLRGVQRKAN